MPLLSTLKDENLKGLHFLDKQIDKFKEEHSVLDEKMEDRTKSHRMTLLRR